MAWLVSASRPLTVEPKAPIRDLLVGVVARHVAQLRQQPGHFMAGALGPHAHLGIGVALHQAVNGRLAVACHIGDSIGQRFHFRRVRHALVGLDRLARTTARHQVGQRHDHQYGKQQPAQAPAQGHAVLHAGRNVDANFQDERNMTGMFAESPRQLPAL